MSASSNTPDEWSNDSFILLETESNQLWERYDGLTIRQPWTRKDQRTVLFCRKFYRSWIVEKRPLTLDSFMDPVKERFNPVVSTRQGLAIWRCRKVGDTDDDEALGLFHHQRSTAVPEARAVGLSVWVGRDSEKPIMRNDCYQFSIL